MPMYESKPALPNNAKQERRVECGSRRQVDAITRTIEDMQEELRKLRAPTNTTLLSCPVCGTDERDDDQERDLERWLQVNKIEVSGPRFNVECFGCGAQTLYENSVEEAIRAWNKRWGSAAWRYATARAAAYCQIPMRGSDRLYECRLYRCSACGCE